MREGYHPAEQVKRPLEDGYQPPDQNRPIKPQALPFVTACKAVNRSL